MACSSKRGNQVDLRLPLSDLERSLTCLDDLIDLYASGLHRKARTRQALLPQGRTGRRGDPAWIGHK